MKVLVMAAEGNPHLDEEQLETYSMGNTTEEEVSRVEQHLLICERCRKQLEETDAFVFSMHHASRRLRAGQQRERWSWVFPRFAPILAAALAVLIVSAAWRVLHTTSAAPVAVILAATRGDVGAPAPAGHPLALKPDLEGLPVLPVYRLEVVDHVGSMVYQGSLQAAATQGGAAVSPLQSGLYFVRVSSPAGELLREYALAVGDRQ